MMKVPTWKKAEIKSHSLMNLNYLGKSSHIYVLLSKRDRRNREVKATLLIVLPNVV